MRGTLYKTEERAKIMIRAYFIKKVKVKIRKRSGSIKKREQSGNTVSFFRWRIGSHFKRDQYLVIGDVVIFADSMEVRKSEKRI